jgi:outer membrane protein assembly factor BamD (BamD/ComL family)
LHEEIVAKYWDTKAFEYSKESLAWAYFELNDFEKTLTETDKLIKDRRIDKAIRDNLIQVKAHSLFNLRRYNEALTAYTEWLGKNTTAPDRLYIQYLQGLCYYRLKAFKNALDTWERVIATPTKDAFGKSALLKVADTLFQGGRFQMARERYRLFATRYPNDPEVADAQLRIAQTFYNDGRDEEAIAAYQYFLAKFPNHPRASDAYAGIENTAFRNTKKIGSDASLQGFLAKYPKSKFADQIQYQIAERAYKLKDFDTAVREFNKLILNYPGSEAIPTLCFISGTATTP